MEVKSLSEALRSIMQQRGCTQTQLGRDLGVTQPWVSDVIRGRVTSTGLAKVMQLLDRVGWEVCFRPKAEESDPVKRREFTAKIVQVGTAAALGGPTFIPSSKASVFMDVQYVRLLGREQMENCDRLGGSALTSSAMRNLNNVWSAITDDGGKLIDGNRDLKIAVSSFACETAWTAFSAGNYAAAGHIAGRALNVARSVNDTDAQSRAYTALSEVSLTQGMAGRGISYARESVRLPGVIPDQYVQSTVRLVRSMALVPGQEKSVWPILDQVQSIDGLSRAVMLTVIGNSGISLADLRRYKDASRLLDEAVRLSEPWPYRQANWVMRQVELACRMGDLSMAADRMRALAGLMPLVSSGRLENHVDRILAGSARGKDSRDMSEARAQLRSVVPVSPVRGGS